MVVNHSFHIINRSAKLTHTCILLRVLLFMTLQHYIYLYILLLFLFCFICITSLYNFCTIYVFLCEFRVSVSEGFRLICWFLYIYSVFEFCGYSLFVFEWHQPVDCNRHESSCIFKQREMGWAVEGGYFGCT